MSKKVFAVADYVKEFLKKCGIPLTRESYLAIDYPGVYLRAPLPAELESELPEEIQIEREGDWIN